MMTRPIRRAALFMTLIAALSTLVTARPALAAPRVSFELVTGNGFPLNASRKWIEVFKDLDGTSVRIRGARGNETTTVENIGTDRAPSYHVVGILLGDNQVRLLGARFKSTDRAKIAQWIKDLRNEGVKGLTAVRLAFGLTSEQLVTFHRQMSPPLSISTKGVRSGDVARAIVRELKIPFEVSPVARQAFARNEVVADELKGISYGTALAATLRPLGLICRPSRRDDGTVTISIKDVGDSEESWPIGWPTKETPASTAPKLYETLKVEIRDTPLAQAIEAIQPRIKLPFVFDYNAMARQQIDPATKLVNFPNKRASYKRILDIVMFQSGLEVELRIDEADTPFLWISGSKR